MFKGILASCITVKFLNLKSVMTKVLEYKAGLDLKFKYVCVTMYSLVMSPFSHDFLIA